MKIKLDITKTLEQNASDYYEKSKKQRKKIEGAKEALEKTEKKLKKVKKEAEEKKSSLEEKKVKKKEWYEKFRWFYSSEGFLCIGGRDATTNEIIIKKYTDDEDIVFHTEMAGSPFFVIKTEGKKTNKSTLEETAQATASFSRAWKAGISSAEVFYVEPKQVTKEAKAGEYIAKGAFMIYGKKNIMTAELKIAIGLKDDKVMAGPVDAIKKHCKDFVTIVQGTEKTSDTAKKVKKRINGGDLDDIIRLLPTGGCKILK